MKANIIVDYYEAFFTSSKPNEGHIYVVMDIVETWVMEDMNKVLLSPLTRQDADLYPFKALGSDWFSTLFFFQKTWGIIGDTVTTSVLNVLNHIMNMTTWNETLVTLILKIPSPKTLEYHLISLCNVCYKLVALAITN